MQSLVLWAPLATRETFAELLDEVCAGDHEYIPVEEEEKYWFESYGWPRKSGGDTCTYEEEAEGHIAQMKEVAFQSAYCV